MKHPLAVICLFLLAALSCGESATIPPSQPLPRRKPPPQRGKFTLRENPERPPSTNPAGAHQSNSPSTTTARKIRPISPATALKSSSSITPTLT